MPGIAGHWAAGYVERQDRRLVQDCAAFVLRVQRERFGREIALPAPEASQRARDRQIDALRGDFAAPVSHPTEGDGVLMRAAGGRRARGYHIGVWCRVDGAPWVLHCIEGLAIVFHPLRDTTRKGWTVEGVYRWL